MKSTNNDERFYCDYNATSPFAHSVREWLAKGEFVDSNPSSQHTSGKLARKIVNSTTNFLFKNFNLSDHQYNLVYHSGATEGINLIFQGFAAHFEKKGERVHFIFSTIDHTISFDLSKNLTSRGHKVSFFKVDLDGNFKVEEIASLIQPNETTLLNYLLVNNEIGVYWPLSKIEKLKEQNSKLSIHVDSSQIIGKIENFFKLENFIDSYTFSAHKFGALKGVGFSFIKKDFLFEPIFFGGGQQQKFRPGTENSFAVQSIPLALSELSNNYDFKKNEEVRIYLEKKLIDWSSGNIIIVAAKNMKRASNTIFFIHPSVANDVLLAALDLKGIEVSSGSACTSGSSLPSRVLLNLGYPEKFAKNGIRISFDPLLTMEALGPIFLSKLASVLTKFN
ncbi:MAG: aminotransferase class V-fold PLP-dependent enzyme [Bacteriovoracaceae bacterium]